MDVQSHFLGRIRDLNLMNSNVRPCTGCRCHVASRARCLCATSPSRVVWRSRARACPLLSPFSLPLLSPSAIVTLLLSSSFLRLLCPPLLATAGPQPATAPPPAEQRAETAATMLVTHRHAVVWLLQPWPPWCSRGHGALALSLSFASALLATLQPPHLAMPPQRLFSGFLHCRGHRRRCARRGCHC